MPRAEAGSTKALSNQLKSKGLGRLRWFCTPCNKQCRDDNGFSCHVKSESHVRNVQAMGQNIGQHIQEYSNQFQTAFLQLLRTSHGEKSVHVNHFYQNYIADKQHVHMNVTKWNSLTEFAKYLGREGICVVEEKEDGFFIAWIDRSPEALRRKETLLKKERERRTDERIEQKQLEDQVRRAEQAKISGGQDGAVEPAVLKGEDNGILAPGQKLSLKFGSNTAKSGEQGQKPATSDSTPTLASTKPKNILAPSKKNVFKKSGSSGKSTSGDSKTQSNGKRQEQFAFDGLGEKDHRPKKVRLA